MEKCVLGPTSPSKRMPIRIEHTLVRSVGKFRSVGTTSLPPWVHIPAGLSRCNLLHKCCDRSPRLHDIFFSVAPVRRKRQRNHPSQLERRCK